VIRSDYKPLSRDQILDLFLSLQRVEPYPFQEEALLAWFSSEEGVLVTAPTGMGKTLIAEAALFEALHTRKVAYYTTPLIALTEQKFREFQAAAVRWGFRSSDVGLITGNRRENPNARILVVVAEILFNRLLHPELFDFENVSAVVMDEFHSFNDPERGVVWEFSLGLLPKHVRLMLLSATVGNAVEFLNWLRVTHGRKLELVQSFERRVPLEFRWVGDMLLVEQIEKMAEGDEEGRLLPALVFCFNREDCWAIADQLRGRRILSDGQQTQLVEELKQYDFFQGAGPKLKQLLLRGVGVHHAGVLPKYRRIVEDLFNRKLLSVCVCTETLSAGINLPARSVVLPSLVKGPSGKRRLLDPSSAHQMFGRAGRPQFDRKGYVIALAHEDDVRLARWKEQYERLPQDVKDPTILKLKKELERKKPKRSPHENYWTDAQFEKLRRAPPENLKSRGPIPWRLLVHMLLASPYVEPIRALVAKRLMERSRIEACQKALDRMLITLWRGGFVELEPEPTHLSEKRLVPLGPEGEKPQLPRPSWLSAALESSQDDEDGSDPGADPLDSIMPCGGQAEALSPTAETYKPMMARPTPALEKLLIFRSVNPLYGVFLVEQLGIADRAERIQALESVLDFPRSVASYVSVPGQRKLPPGPLAMTRLDEQLVRLGLATYDELRLRGEPEEGETAHEDRPRRSRLAEPPKRILTLAEKLRLLFDYLYPGVHDIKIVPVWAAGELLEMGGDFYKVVTAKGLQKQEGILFRHLLRMILLVREFTELPPPECDDTSWKADLLQVAEIITEACRRVDPTSTDRTLEQAEAADEYWEF
jgi:superfamily II DNA/RNA helicase